jgi:hypothetical protein
MVQGTISTTNHYSGVQDMAKTQIKVCGPTRGKRRVRMMGMGSGRRRAEAKAKNKSTRG